MTEFALYPPLKRRHLLGAIGAGGVSLFAPRLAFAASTETDRRFLFVIQRGAADGLSALAPIGDAAFHEIRGALADDFNDAPKIDGMFALHPALENIGRLYAANQALFVHAAASPYRDRSHFDAQDVLETGGSLPYQLHDGWMNRFLALLPGSTRAMAVGATVPMALRGKIDVPSYGNSALPEANEELLQRVGALYSADPQLKGLWDASMQARGMAMGDAEKGQDPAALGRLAAKLMSGPAGARVAMVETSGWDTHFNQRGRLTNQFKQLDLMIAALKEGLGPDWSRTLVLVATEFGRTVAINGTQGSDHGTGSMAMLLGGAVAGGRVVSDWPGLKKNQLYEGRDLRPTISLDSLIAGALGSHFAIDPAQIMATSFPGSRERALEGLVKV